MHTSTRARLLNAVYKNHFKTISSMVDELNDNLIAESLKVSCEYCHPDCVAVLLPLASPPDIGALLQTTMEAYDAVEHEQSSVVDMLLPLLSDKQCEDYADQACERDWKLVFPKIIDRVNSPNSTNLRMDWAAKCGHLDDIKKYVPQCDDQQLTRTLFLAAEAGQWDVARFLIPLSSPFDVLCDMEIEHRNGHGHYTVTMERFKKVIEEVEMEQQRARLLNHVDTQSTRKPSVRKI